jgi:dTDP-glucose pyrophosphorylase
VVIRECETESTGVWVNKSFPQAVVQSVPGNGYRGALVSAIVAAGSLPSTSQLVVCAGDSQVDGGLHEELLSFSDTGVDGGVVCFESSQSRWSYAKLQENNLDVLEISEKKVISNFATVGCFYFSSVRKFLEAAEWCLVNNASTNGDFFTSMALNHLVASGEKVEARVIETNRYKSYSGPQDFPK